MCTVTYVPNAKGCWLTSNRDEKPQREPAAPPGWHPQPIGEPLYYASDALAGGTWMATQPSGNTAILLNGADKAFVPQGQYRLSRGLVLLQLMRMPNLVDGFRQMDLSQIAPFTCIYFDHGLLWQCRWDGSNRNTTAMDSSQAHLWSSFTLYDHAAQQQRQQWFANWQQDHPNPQWDDILKFHSWHQPQHPGQSICMHRPDGIRTISISSVQVQHMPVFHYQAIGQPQYA